MLAECLAFDVHSFSDPQPDCSLSCPRPAPQRSRAIADCCTAECLTSGQSSPVLSVTLSATLSLSVTLWRCMPAPAPAPVSRHPCGATACDTHLINLRCSRLLRAAVSPHHRFTILVACPYQHVLHALKPQPSSPPSFTPHQHLNLPCPRVLGTSTRKTKKDTTA
jgi:hypothetical protein